MSTRRIIEAFDAWSTSGLPIALATVYDTRGSTYSKAGHRIVIAGNGEYCGLVSGGCLENDLAEHAVNVLESGIARPVTYDMRDDVDDVFGLGVGCNGLIRVFIQPLLPADDYQPFASLRPLYDESHSTLSATVIESDAVDLPPGSVFVSSAKGEWESPGKSSAPKRFTELFGALGISLSAENKAAHFERCDGLGILFAPIHPIPRLLIAGAGPDAVPLVNMAVELGWNVEVVDHRPAYLERDELSVADKLRLVDPRNAAEFTGGTRGFGAAIVMSHHLDTDEAFLRALASSNLRYLGVLGPPSRRARLLTKLEADFPELRNALRGPIGLDIGGTGPEAIALSILAELQSVFSGRD